MVVVLSYRYIYIFFKVIVEFSARHYFLFQRAYYCETLPTLNNDDLEDAWADAAAVVNPPAENFASVGVPHFDFFNLAPPVPAPQAVPVPIELADVAVLLDEDPDVLCLN